MRFGGHLALVVTIACLPTVLVAQYPSPGHYLGTASQPGDESGDGGGHVWLQVDLAGDSTTITHGVVGQPAIPVTDQHLIGGGFFIAFGGLECPFVTVDSGWEAICTDGTPEPLFVVRFPAKPEPAGRDRPPGRD